MVEEVDKSTLPSNEKPAQKTKVRTRTDSTLDERSSKIAHIDPSNSPSRSRRKVIRCSLPPHKPMRFESLQDYEDHYSKNHSNRCFTCQKNFPTEHYLELHIAENHDPINEVKRERGEKTVRPQLKSEYYGR